MPRSVGYLLTSETYKNQTFPLFPKDGECTGTYEALCIGLAAFSHDRPFAPLRCSQKQSGDLEAAESACKQYPRVTEEMSLLSKVFRTNDLQTQDAPLLSIPVTVSGKERYFFRD